MPYADPEKQREAHNAACKRWRVRAKQRYDAQQMVKRAVKNGTLIRWPGCAACHRKRGLEAHHCDYEQPLQVVWLCMKCHKATHAIARLCETDLL